MENEKYININLLKKEIDKLQDSCLDINKNFISAYDEGFFDGISYIDSFIDNNLNNKETITVKENSWTNSIVDIINTICLTIIIIVSIIQCS